MTIGTQASKATIDTLLTNYALSMRNIMRLVGELNTYINGGGNGLSYLEGLGYSGTANPANPGGVSDAQMALNYIAEMWNVAQVYYGTLFQGPTAASAIQFNFNNSFAPLWAGQ